jgi:hypothetical protein
MKAYSFVFANLRRMNERTCPIYISILFSATRCKLFNVIIFKMYRGIQPAVTIVCGRHFPTIEQIVLAWTF